MLPGYYGPATAGTARVYTVPVIGAGSRYRLRITENGNLWVLSPVKPMTTSWVTVMPGSMFVAVDTAGGSVGLPVATLVAAWRMDNERAPTERPTFDQLAWLLAMRDAGGRPESLVRIDLDAFQSEIDAYNTVVNAVGYPVVTAAPTSPTVIDLVGSQ